MMRCRDGIRLARAAGRVLPPCVADPGDDPRLVVRRPVRDAIAEPRGDDVGVLDERLCCRAVRPAARVLERLRGVPVEERRERGNPRGEQVVDEPVVEVETGLVHPAAAFRENARPGDREAERVEPELAHELDVLRIAVVEVTRDRPGVSAPNLAGRRAEAIPDALAAAVLVDSALDLVRGRRGTPDEVGHASTSSAGALTWQRADCSGRASTSDGVTREQTSIASGQRWTKRQPAGGSTAADASPLRISMRLASSPVAGSGTAERSSCVYGWSGFARTSSIGPRSTIWPAYMTRMSSAM